jgi:hypothetical protein
VAKQRLKIQYKESNFQDLAMLGKHTVEEINKAVEAVGAQLMKKGNNEEFSKNPATYPGPEEKSVRNEDNFVVWHSSDYSKVTLSNKSPHAVWVEFGTGIKGQKGAKKATAGAKTSYKPRNHGWTYRADDGMYYHTNGQVSRPFMLTTYMKVSKYLRDLFQDKGYWAKEFSAALKRTRKPEGYRGGKK